MKAAHEYFRVHDRGKLIMACGTGKTYTSLEIIEQETGGQGTDFIHGPQYRSLRTIAECLDDRYEIQDEGCLYLLGFQGFQKERFR